jgi:hypothetical protein
MVATTKRGRPHGRTFYTTVVVLSILTVLSFLKQSTQVVEPRLRARQEVVDALTKRDLEVSYRPHP